MTNRGMYNEVTLELLCFSIPNYLCDLFLGKLILSHYYSRRKKAKTERLLRLRLLCSKRSR